MRGLCATCGLLEGWKSLRDEIYDQYDWIEWEFEKIHEKLRQISQERLVLEQFRQNIDEAAVQEQGEDRRLWGQLALIELRGPQGKALREVHLRSTG